MNDVATLPTSTPAEVIQISPEALEIANAYLSLQNVVQVAENLGIAVDAVTQTLARREVRTYIDHVFMDVGFNNRFKMAELMDTIIAKKLQELDDTGVVSGKDIIEILTLRHKMTMDALDREIALRKLEQSNVKNQTNVQINDNSVSEGSRYGQLLQNIINGQVQSRNQVPRQESP